MKSEAKLKSKELRKQGKSINEIASLLGVSKGSVSIWVRDIELTDNQIKELEQQNPIYNNQLHGSKERANKARKQRSQYQQLGKEKAKEGNLLHQAGCMLYWAEGYKSKNTCAIVNTDVNLLKFFMNFLKENFNLTNQDFKITINYYTNNGLSKNDIENYWLNQLDLPQEAIRKGQENNRPRSSTGAIRHNKHPYGMCNLIVKKSTYIVQHIYGAIQEYAKFNNDYMLY